ncbi:MAG: helix-turn-helix domain-containing protein [Gammaproteobacteria bacterium]|nr:helix-turn-helix domain-containing protein [Gammaproteobacteria bacterium]
MTETNSFGNKLRLARERRGLSQEEAAKALCLNVEVINALECEQFDKLPSPVFVRGYIKNYANLLRLTINEKPSKPSAHVVAAPVSSTHEKKVANRLSMLGYFPAKIFNYVIALVLVALVFVWWHERRHAIEKIDTTGSIINMSIEKIPFQRQQSLKSLLPIKPDKDLMKEVFPGWPL